MHAIQSVLDSALEDVENVRNEVLRMNTSLACTSLEDLCKSFHSISQANQRMLDQVECQLEADPSSNYMSFASKRETLQASTSTSLSSAAPSEQTSTSSRQKGSTTSTLSPANSSYFHSCVPAACDSPPTAALPAHLQVVFTTYWYYRARFYYLLWC